MGFETGPRQKAGWPSSDGRTWVALGVAVVATAVLLFLLVVAAGATASALEELLHRVLHGRPDGVLTVAARRVTDLGSSPVLYPVTFAMGWLVGTRRGWRRLLDVLLAPLLLAAGSAARFGLSLAVGRLRPPPADWLYPASGAAFPSGHTANTTIAAGLLVLLYQRRRPPRRRQVAAWCAGLLAAAAVGLSRVYLGVHWPTDVAGGWAFGVAWVALVASAGDHIGRIAARSRWPSAGLQALRLQALALTRSLGAVELRRG